MRRARAATVATMIALMLVASRAHAGAREPDYWDIHDVATNDMLNVRSAASPDATLIGQIAPTGTCLKNLGCRYGIGQQRQRWCRVERSGVVGWVAARYLRASVQPCP
jgi:uncharacterized protein YraI